MKERILIAIGMIFLLLPMFVLAQESSPQFPHLFYGTSKFNSIDSPVESIIVAKVDGIEKGRITTTEVGKYGGPAGNQNKLLVQGDIQEGATVEFFTTFFFTSSVSSNIKANEVASFKSGKIEEKNLTWNFPPVVEVSGTSFSTEPIKCIPGTTIEVEIASLTLQISCTTISSGTINSLTNLGSTFFVGPPGGTTKASDFFEISITGNFDIVATMSYSDVGIDESLGLDVYKFDGTSWVAIPDSDIISIDTVANKITFRIPASSTPYSIFANLPPPAPLAAPPSGGFALVNITPPTPSVAPVCGNNICESDEDSVNCPQDCPAPTPSTPPPTTIPITPIGGLLLLAEPIYVAGLILLIIAVFLAVMYWKKLFIFKRK